MYEAIFTAACERAFAERNVSVGDIDPARLEKLKKDDAFLQASRYLTTSKENVALRIERAKQIILT